MAVSKELSAYFRELGRKGGSKTSERKAAASKRNGSKRKAAKPKKPI